MSHAITCDMDEDCVCGADELDVLCKCGHPLGTHTAERFFMGSQPCLAGDDGEEVCDCQCFTTAMTPGYSITVTNDGEHFAASAEIEWRSLHDPGWGARDVAIERGDFLCLDGFDECYGADVLWSILRRITREEM